MKRVYFLTMDRFYYTMALKYEPYKFITMQTNASTQTQSKTIEFTDYTKIKPSEVIGFSTEYLNHIPLLKDYLRANPSKFVKLPVLRIGNNGLPTRKYLSGYASTVLDDSFIFYTYEDFFISYDEPISLKIQFVSLLGEVPLHPDFPEMNPYIVNAEKFSTLINSLNEMKDLLKEFMPEKHAATLYFRLCDNKDDPAKESPIKFKVIECAILEVNKSNLKCKEFRSYVYTEGNHNQWDHVTLGTGNEIFEKLITANSYLQKVIIKPGIAHEVSMSDD